MDAHRVSIPDSSHLDLILCQKYTRTVSKNLTVRYNNKIYQIQTKRPGYTLRGAQVQVHDKQGDIRILYKHQALTYQIFNSKQQPTPIMNSKQLNRHLDRKKKYKPAADHPWRKTAISVPRATPTLADKK